MIPRLAPGEPFPTIDSALGEPYNGLLAASWDLSPARVVQAYRHGIFPWYSEGEPVLWWSPDPRMVLHADEFKPSRSLRRHMQMLQADADVTIAIDRDFEAVMRACADRAQPIAPPPGHRSTHGQPADEDDGDEPPGTWITDQMVEVYVALHRAGLAHSVEMRRSDRLIGGLYGVSLGRMFFGESMFTRESNASKTALAVLVHIALEEGIAVIDCQQATQHLTSLGGRTISRRAFCAHVAQAVRAAPVPWAAYQQAAPRDLIDRLFSR